MENWKGYHCSMEMDQKLVLTMAYLWKIINRLLPFQTKRRAIFKFSYNFITDPSLSLLSSGIREVFRSNKKHDKILIPEFIKISSLNKAKSFEFPHFLDPVVSIIIPVWNKWVYTYNCLLKIAQNTHNISFEVIVLDNASTDHTPQMLSKINNIRSIRNKKNEGFIRACNKGASIAKGKYLLFLNNDTLVTPDWLSSMISLFKKYRKVGIVGAKLIYPDGKLQEAGGIVLNDPVNLAWNYGRYDDPNKWEYNYVKEVDYCSGACLLVRKDLFEHIGLFDMQFSPAYCEDTDLAFSIRKLGYKVMYQPKAEIIHFEGTTAGVDTSHGFKSYQIVNQEKFYNKWKDTLEREYFKNGENVFLARDRSQINKIMLFVDHYVPAWDKDAGSLLTYELLRIFLEMGFKIIFLPDDMLKVEPYTSELQQMGIEVLYDTNIRSRNYLKKYGMYINVSFLSRPHISVKYIDDLRKYTKAKVIYFPVDLNFLRLLRKYEIKKSKKIFSIANKIRLIELNLTSKSDATVVLSSAEKDILKADLKKADVVTIPFLYRQNLKKKEINKFSDRKELLFLGGFMHEPNEDAVVWFVENIYPLIKKEIGNIKFYIAGSNPTSKVLQLKSSDIIVTGYVNDVTPLFRKAKVFVSPLRYGAGVKGKILQSMSYGLPVISTSIGAEGIDVKNMEHILIADQAEEFAKQTLKLYTDKELWCKLSRNSIRYIEENHSAGVVREKYASLFYELGILP